MGLAPIPAGDVHPPMAGQELQQTMPPAENVAANIVATTDQISSPLLHLARHVDGGELPRAIEMDELGRVAPVGFDPPPRAPGLQGRRDPVAGHAGGTEPTGAG